MGQEFDKTRTQFLLITFHFQPGSTTVNALFFEEFADVIERLVVHAAPIIIVGDMNVHLDVASATATMSFCDILAGADLVQHVIGSTHREEHTLDVVLTYRDISTSVSVDPPAISDHSLITANVALELAASSASSTYTKRLWADFDCSAFREDLRESTLLTSSHADSSEFYLCYDETLRWLLDKHAPSRKIVRRSRVLSPWFNAVCRMAKIETRRLEKVYRLTHTIIAYCEWQTQSIAQRRIYQTPILTSGRMLLATVQILSRCGAR